MCGLTRDEDKQKPDETRRPYRKPRIERVRLQPEEAVLSACKNPGWGPCAPPGQPPSRRPGS